MGCRTEFFPAARKRVNACIKVREGLVADFYTDHSNLSNVSTLLLQLGWSVPCLAEGFSDG